MPQPRHNNQATKIIVRASAPSGRTAPCSCSASILWTGSGSPGCSGTWGCVARPRLPKTSGRTSRTLQSSGPRRTAPAPRWGPGFGETAMASDRRHPISTRQDIYVGAPRRVRHAAQRVCGGTPPGRAKEIVKIKPKPGIEYPGGLERGPEGFGLRPPIRRLGGGGAAAAAGPHCFCGVRALQSGLLRVHGLHVEARRRRAQSRRKEGQPSAPGSEIGMRHKSSTAIRHHKNDYHKERAGGGRT